MSANYEQLLTEMQSVAAFAKRVGAKKEAATFEKLHSKLLANKKSSKALEEEVFDARGMASFWIPSHISKSKLDTAAKERLNAEFSALKQKLDEALKLSQSALKTEPDNPSYLDSLGWVYYKLGKLDLAEQNLKKAMTFDVSSATIHEHLGDVYQKQGKTELAKTSWQKALTLSSDVEQINGIKTKLGGRKPAK